MRIKVADATGPVLDWMVSSARGDSDIHPYSTNQEDGELIIEQEGIDVKQGNPLIFPKGNEKGEYSEPLWIAGKMHGRTMLEAAMRCYVASKLGDEVDVPDELA